MIKVYYSIIKSYDCNYNLIKSLGEVRADYVNAITDVKRRAQSLYVWKLLQYGLKVDYSIKLLNFCRSDNGAWSLGNNDLFFSLSHSSDVVAVAVSDNLVGIDVQICSDKILKVKKLFPFIVDEDNLVASLTIAWTKKESLFKCPNGNNFYTEKILNDRGEEFFLTVCSKSKSGVIIENVDFNLIYK